MDRRAFLGALAGGLLAAPLAVAQPKVPRIGLLIWYASDPGVQELFRRGFREAGYVEGQNVVFEWRWAERKPARAAELARELVRLNVDVLVVHPTPVIEPAQNATRTIPIVVLAGNPVGTGAAASLARPGGNTTGVSTNAVELAGKRLELLREILPRMRRVGFLAYSGDANGPLFVDQTRATAQRMGIQMLPQFVRGPEEFDAAFAAIVKNRAEALMVQPVFTNEAKLGRRIAEFALRHRLPTASQFPQFTEAGGLIAYGASSAALYRQVAEYVDRILKGARPADLPIQEPTQFELIINLKTARALGLTIPPSLLQRADLVIE